MSNYSFFVGIDVSKSVVDVSFHKDGTVQYLGQFTNRKTGFDRMIKVLKTKTPTNAKSWFVCFENTGVYSKLLLEYLIKADIPCIEESALRISRSLGIRRGKDDKVDSMDICQYVYEKRERLKASKLPSALIVRLRKLLSRRDFLVRQRQSLKVSLNEQKNYIEEELYKELNEGNKSIIDVYNKEIKELERSIEALIASEQKTSRNHKLAQSVIGIGSITSAYIIAVTENYTVFIDSKKFACYCGIAPFPNRSGTRKGNTRISHIANKKMKSLFSNCCMSAINHDPEISKYYKRKREEGKKPGVVLNAVKNKLIHRVFSVVKRQTPYVKIMSYA